MSDEKLNRREWIKVFCEYFTSKGVGVHKSSMWAESVLNNDENAINRCPKKEAEIDFFDL